MQRAVGSIRYDIAHSPVDHRGGKSKDAGDDQEPWKILIHSINGLGFVR
jgi:hypothetical protein